MRSTEVRPKRLLEGNLIVNEPMTRAQVERPSSGGAGMAMAAVAATVIVVLVTIARPAIGADPGSLPGEPGTAQPKALPGEGGGPYTDPLAPFNEAMFTFNLDLDQWVVTPVAKGYSYVLPQPARKSVSNFFNNVDIIRRFANNLFQLHFEYAGTELARFGINSTLGVAGLFDVADDWFGLQQHNNDFGLTMGHYGIYSGPYVMLPFFGPSTVRDTVGLVADGAMNPMGWLLPWWVTLSADAGSESLNAINYRSLHPNEFEEADRYAVDLYGAVQDAYMQTRAAQLRATMK
jgi:phospholipid-binding lipoprotein MlaA